MISYLEYSIPVEKLRAAYECPICKPKAEPKPEPKPEPETLTTHGAQGNIQREAAFRLLVGVEKALAKLPQDALKVAGFLYGKGYAGTVSGRSNALSKYLRDECAQQETSECLSKEMSEAVIGIDSMGWLYVTNTKYRMRVKAPEWMKEFALGLATYTYPELLV